MSKMSSLEHAKYAALAEQRILMLLDMALRDDLTARSFKSGLSKTARSRPGHRSSGQLN